MLLVSFGAILLTMAHSSFSVDQMYSFYSCNDESDSIGKIEEPLSDNNSSEDALVPPSPSALYGGSERLDLEDPVVPEVDQQIAQPTVSSSSESLMDSDEEIMMVRYKCISIRGVTLA